MGTRFSKKNFMCLALAFILFLSILSINSFAFDSKNLFNSNNGATASTSDTGTLSETAMLRYISSGLFDDVSGTSCSSLLASKPSSQSLENFLQAQNNNGCGMAYDYYFANKTYVNYVVNGLKKHDQHDVRLNNALEGFNEHAQFIYTFLSGFGCLTSLLVFIIIFIRITWLPEHATQKRRAMEDILTSGIATILLGGFWLIIGLFQSMFDRFWESNVVYTKDWLSAGNVFLLEYKSLIVGISGVAALTAFLMFIKSVTSLAISGSNPMEKKAKMQQILYTGIAAAGLGAITLVVGIFWGMLR